MAISTGSKCRSCGAPIVWAKGPRGNAMRLELPPVKRWTVVGGEARLVDTYEPHFAHCPDAERWRKP